VSHTTDPDQRATVVGPDEGESIWFLNSRMTIKVTGESTDGRFGLTEAVVPPGFSPPLHIHHHEEESFYVLDGELVVRCGDETLTASSGSFVRLPRGVPHSFIVSSETPVRMLNLMTPGGGERFFADAGRPAEHDGMPAPGPVDVERLRRAGRTYGSEIIGPPLTRAS
jgi:mannose-6-phosphate isomerase-like protein (cupin superfamily)